MSFQFSAFWSFSPLCLGRWIWVLKSAPKWSQSQCRRNLDRVLIQYKEVNFRYWYNTVDFFGNIDPIQRTQFQILIQNGRFFLERLIWFIKLGCYLKSIKRYYGRYQRVLKSYLIVKSVLTLYKSSWMLPYINFSIIFLRGILQWEKRLIVYIYFKGKAKKN